MTEYILYGALAYLVVGFFYGVGLLRVFPQTHHVAGEVIWKSVLLWPLMVLSFVGCKLGGVIDE